MGPTATTTAPRTATTSVALVHLGCEKNLVDSERILGALAGDGHAICQDPTEAEVVIVNTCGFIAPAKRESLDAICAAVAGKRAGATRAVIVAGCLAQRYAADLQRDIPGIDAIVGLGDLPRLREVCAAVAARGRRRAPAIPDAPLPAGMSLYPVGLEGSRLRLTPRHYAYLRIAEGCDHPCAFCAIPLMRGKNRSKPIETLVAEATELVADGARELVLIAQDSGSYGIDTLGRQALPELIRALGKVPGLSGQRLMYLHPAMATRGIVETFGDEPTLLPYVDLPIQHGSEPMLRRMRRGTTPDLLRERVASLRARDPRMTLRTTVLVGFPGETETDVDATAALLEELAFDRLGTFLFSSEEGTPAHTMPDAVPATVARARRRRIMEVQRSVVARRAPRRVGEVVDATVDRVTKTAAFARTYGEAPEVDGAVRLPARGRRPGERLRVEITGVSGYDLRATVAG